MTESELRSIAGTTLHQIVPDVPVATLRADAPLREQVDMDSIDFLRWLVALHQQTGVEIPETEYAHLRSLDDFVAYLARHQVVGGSTIG